MTMQDELSQTATTRPTAWHRPVRTLKALGLPGAISLIFVMIVVLAAICAPWLTPYGPAQINVGPPLTGPTGAHLMGTDELGRDLLTRLIFGLRITLLVTAGAVAVSMVLGVIWGMAAGLGARWLDELLMRLVDGAIAIPSFLLALMFVAAFGSSTFGLIFIIGVLNAPVVARLARSAVMEESSSDYAIAARASGASPLRVVWLELFPNTVPTLLVQASLVAGYAILTEAGLSFVGLGVQPPETSLGNLLLVGYQNLYTYPGYVVWPGLTIVALVWALNTVGDNLRRALDPRAAAQR
ncbi:ABC transporter permease [Microbacterium alcoholitolerans]|uniref:ABC transporter permease n=1 Tax=unclassified Microbacterium TaxID=2609290 RepID=UPI003D17B9F2